jgi:hypothetical protein
MHFFKFAEIIKKPIFFNHWQPFSKMLREGIVTNKKRDYIKFRFFGKKYFGLV